MDWLSEYLKAWSRHGIHFGTAIKHLNILSPPASTEPLIVDDECSIYRFPFSYRTKAKRGELNYWFLESTSLLRVLDGLPEHLIVILPIPEIWKTEGMALNEFVENLDNFLPTLPSSYRYAIQLHNRNYLLPDYFECLSRHNVAHAMHDSSDYPVFTTDFGLMLEADLSKTIQAVRYAVEEKKRLYVYMDDPAAVAHLMKLLNHDLKKLSPIQRNSAAA
jgi:hypothetical protein